MQRIDRRLMQAAGAFALLAGLPAHAAPINAAADLDQLSIEDLANVEITSVAKRPQSLTEAPASIFVITREDIRRSGAANIPEALRLAPNLIVAQFWHIPWPNREVFRAFPWGEELLDGLLGNDLLGFHLRYHCGNFVDTVDRGIEAKVDYEHLTVTRGGRSTSCAWCGPATGCSRASGTSTSAPGSAAPGRRGSS